MLKKALQSLAKDVFSENSSLVIGVTGTVGKTTTKEFLATLLSEKFRVMKTLKSQNSQVGLPLTLLNWEGQEEICVLEMGMSQKGELSKLVDVAPPHLGILTKVTLAHSAFFEGLEEIAEAKCELFSSREIERGFFNQSTRSFSAVQRLKIPKTWFGIDEGDVTLKNLSFPMTERHFQENFLAAASVALHLGMTPDAIEAGAKKLKPFDHRFEKVKKKGALFIDDSYNASPEAMKAALSSLPKGRKVVGFLGTMKELGKFEEVSHKEVGQHAQGLLDHLICIGEESLPMAEAFQAGGKPAEHFKDKNEATARLKEVVQEGDVVLIKGSSSLKLWTAIEDF